MDGWVDDDVPEHFRREERYCTLWLTCHRLVPDGHKSRRTGAAQDRGANRALIAVGTHAQSSS